MLTIVDRYLLALFIKIFAISFLSFAGLYVVIHCSTNLDDLATVADELDGFGPLLVDFYGPRVLDIFDRSAGMLVLISAVFALGLVERRREMVAIQSAGVPKLRLVRPILVGAIFAIGLSGFVREIWIPKFREQLVRTPQTWLDSGSVPMSFQKDPRSGIILRGDELFVDEGRISNLEAGIPIQVCPSLSTLEAKMATVEPAREGRPAGLLLRQVKNAEEMSKVPSAEWNGEKILYLPSDTSWLRPDQAFLAIDVHPAEIAYGNQMARYASLPELMESLRRPRNFYGNGPKVELHSRILQPVTHFVLVLLGVPLVLGKREGSLVKSVGMCLMIVLLFQLTIIGSQSLGSLNLVRPAVLAVWLPLMVFLPISVLMVRRLGEV